ncbi:MAG: hypothetical protein MK180_03035 [Rhodobacteraceae bacterium]|nr:hypothetical protein [Paracoccaceae bacterium]
MLQNQDEAHRSRAISIYQQWLDEVGELVLAGASDKLIDRHVALPYLHRSLDTEMVVETAEEMTTGWSGFGEFMKTNGATHYIRSCKSASFLSDDYIEGTHNVYIMRDSQTVVDPYHARMVLRNNDGHWRMCETSSAFWHSRWPISTIRTPSIPVDAFTDTPHDARRLGKDPREILQGYLDTLTRRFRQQDFTPLFDQIDFPFSCFTIADSMEISSRAFAVTILAGAIQRYQVIFNETFALQATHAELIGPTTLFGYYTSALPDCVLEEEYLRGSILLSLKNGAWYLKSLSLLTEDQEQQTKRLTRYDIARRARLGSGTELPR